MSVQDYCKLRNILLRRWWDDPTTFLTADKAQRGIKNEHRDVVEAIRQRLTRAGAINMGLPKYKSKPVKRHPGENFIGAHVVIVGAGLAGLAVTVAFAPQIAESWRCRGRGSLSYVFYAIQVVGCALVFTSQKFFLHDSVLVWGPTAVAGTMQAVVLAIGLYFRTGLVRRRVGRGSSSQPMLRDALCHLDEHGDVERSRTGSLNGGGGERA